MPLIKLNDVVPLKKAFSIVISLWQKKFEVAYTEYGIPHNKYNRATLLITVNININRGMIYIYLSLSINLSLFRSVLFALIKGTPSSLCGLWKGNYSIYKYPD